MKKFVIAWVGATLVGFTLAGVWHGVLMSEMYETGSEAVARPEADVSMAMD